SLSFLVQETRLLLLAELLPASSAKFLRKVYHDACLAAKPSILSWADLFDWPDFVLRSPLGIRDGDMYQHYFDTVASAPGATGQPPYWSQYIGKLTVLRASL
ncbi:MAG: acyl-CoA dehydrogenase, partial [archaeon]|nr:acyl-CoA dehydrogenase [archaeon]